jgi:hypothetical protein
MIPDIVPYITNPIGDFPEGCWADWAFVTTISKNKKGFSMLVFGLSKEKRALLEPELYDLHMPHSRMAELERKGANRLIKPVSEDASRRTDPSYLNSFTLPTFLATTNQLLD